jgi:hypothetical protein
MSLHINVGCVTLSQSFNEANNLVALRTINLKYSNPKSFVRNFETMGRIELLLSDYNSRHELRTPARMKIPFPFLLPSALCLIFKSACREIRITI